MKKKAASKEVVSNVHKDAKKKAIPTSEMEQFVSAKTKAPVTLKYPRNPDLDPQLVWRGKDALDEKPLSVDAYPIYIQEKIHPKMIIADLESETKARKKEREAQMDFFADFNGVPEGANRMDFYSYEQNWTNRMILGDSLQVMASLAEKENLRGKVQCVYFDPPYGIRFNSNFQWSTTTTNVKDGVDATREPEMVKAFRDTWKDGINSYLSYIRDRLTIARDLLSPSGSIFVQIGDENVHRVRAVLDEVFGSDNFVCQIIYKKTGGLGTDGLKSVADYILWYARDKNLVKRRKYLISKVQGEGASTGERYIDAYDSTTGTYRTLTDEERDDAALIPASIATFRYDNLASSGYTKTCIFDFGFEGKSFLAGGGKSWKTNFDGMIRLGKAGRIGCTGASIQYRRFLNDYAGYEGNNIWSDCAVRTDKQYVVETSCGAIERCLLIATDPGDIVLDPTCGSGTTAYVAEQWGRRWITIDTSRVALALARARLMGARYPYYILSDTPEGQRKEAEASGKVPATNETFGRLRQGFVYERVPHITLKSIANNQEIDVIWDACTPEMDEIRKKIGNFEEWELPRPETPEAKKLDAKLLAKWWELRIARQKKIDASIQKNADFELMYDRPYTDNSKVRVAGPFTIESLSPYRSMTVGADDELIDPLDAIQTETDYQPVKDFAEMILDELKKAGVQQSDKKNRISFTSLEPGPGNYICACGTYERDCKLVRAGIFVGPEFGTVTQADLIAACKEAKMTGYDEVVSCAFSYEANIGALDFPGMPIIKARMNADLHMAGDLKATGSGNLFVVFGEPQIDLIEQDDGKWRVKILGVDIFDPKKGEVRSSEAADIACWFIDTNYNQQSFFVRHAYFLGQKDPYEALKKSLNASIDREAWETIYRDESRPFETPDTHYIAVKIINHLGDEVMKVFQVPPKKNANK